MYILEVIPLTSLPVNAPQILSYFCNENLSCGAIVEIPLGSRKITAVVISSDPVDQIKISLKKTGYQLKQISKILFEKPQVSEYQLKIASWIAKSYYAPLGLAVKSVIPPFAFKKKYARSDLRVNLNDSPQNLERIKPTIILTEAKSLTINLKLEIESTLKDGKQVAVLVSDKTIASYLAEEIKVMAVLGSNKIAIASSSLPNKIQFDVSDGLESGEIKIVIGTRSVLFNQFHNLGLLIVEDSNNEMYKSDVTPKYNAVNLAEEIARLNNANLILANQALGVTDYFNIVQAESSLVDRRLHSKSSIEIADIIQEFKNDNFSIFSQKLKAAMVDCVNNGEKILILSPRLGYSGTLMCQNCGAPAKCPNCEIPMRVHKTVDLVLVCHHCAQSRQMPDHCPNCNSAKLRPSGSAGSQKIFETIMRFIEYGQMKKVPVLILDSDVIKNDLEENEALEVMNKLGAAILISTQMIYGHRFKYNFDLVGIINIDALTTFVDFQIEERLSSQIRKISDFKPRKLIIQTYNPDSSILSYIVNGKIDDFLKSELQVRKLFLYPPYAKIIKLSYRHLNKQKAYLAARVASEKLRMARMQLKLEDKIMLNDSSTTFLTRENNYYYYNMILKADPSVGNLREFLKYVPSGWNIDVDPSNIF